MAVADSSPKKQSSPKQVKTDQSVEPLDKLIEIGINLEQQLRSIKDVLQANGKELPSLPDIKKRNLTPKDPDAPRKPPSAYLMYQNQLRQKYKQERPEVTQSEFMGFVGKNWQNMPSDEKQVSY